jgi:hypothetical protein
MYLKITAETLAIGLPGVAVGDGVGVGAGVAATGGVGEEPESSPHATNESAAATSSSDGHVLCITSLLARSTRY